MNLRRRAAGHGGLTNDQIIIVVVVSLVGTLVLVAILYRLARYIRGGSRAVPLPPIQPLAHHRERQLSRLSRIHRPSTYFDSEFLPVPTLGRNMSNSSFHGSKTSLVSESSPDDDLRKPHLQLKSSSSSSFDFDQPLDTPSTSLSSGTKPRHNSISSSARAGSTRPRTLSVYSTSSVAMSRRQSTSTLKGTPHSRPRSQVQIVLPAPLAPGMLENSQSFYGEFSMLDSWAPAPSRSLSVREQRVQSPHSGHVARRASSASYSLPHAARPLGPSPPPVPRIPSIYNTQPTTIHEEDRGRSRDMIDNRQRRARSATLVRNRRTLGQEDIIV